MDTEEARSMRASVAIRLAGGSAAALRRIFLVAGIRLSRQAVQQWVCRPHLPQLRELQLRNIRREWFIRGSNGQKSSKAKAVSLRKAAAIKPRRGPRTAGQAQRTDRRGAAV